MQTKGEYTPGPWSVHTEDDSSISRARSVYICTEQGWPDGQLARVNVQDGLGEREANARLIAAAPELLEALTNLLTETELPYGPLLRLRQDEARAAIARAKGLHS